MRNQVIAGHKIEFYDSIDVMKTARMMQFQKNVHLESVGGDPENADRIDKEILHYNKKGDTRNVDILTKNRNQSLHFALSNINPGTISHACWVSSIDGKKVLNLDGRSINLHDHSDEGLQALARVIENWDTPKGHFYRIVKELKKKLRTSLKLLFLKCMRLRMAKSTHSMNSEGSEQACF